MKFIIKSSQNAPKANPRVIHTGYSFWSQKIFLIYSVLKYSEDN